MDFSFSSILNISISGSLLIGILFLLLKNNKVLIRFGVTLALVCALLIMLRLFLPFEFSFTTSVYIKNIWPDIYLFLKGDLFYIGRFGISLCDFMLWIWIAGSAFLSLRSIRTYRSIKRTISGYKPLDNPVINATVSRLNAAYPRQKDFCLVEADEIMTPMIFGIRKPYIILPAITLAEAEWAYILKHEISHYYCGHLYYKLFCEVLCDLYWWNPFVYLLKRFLTNLLEMNVDLTVTNSLDDVEKLEYLDCLLKVTRLNALANAKIQWAVTFSSRESPLISQRIHLICDSMADEKKGNYLPVFALALGFVIFMGCSFFFTIEPDTYCESPVNAEDTFSFNENDCFLVRNSSGTYDVYMNSQYLVTLDKPIEGDSNIKIYNNYKEIPKHEKN